MLLVAGLVIWFWGLPVAEDEVSYSLLCIPKGEMELCCS